MIGRSVAAALLTVVTGAALLAQQPPASSSVTVERPVVTRGRGPHKLRVDATVLTGAQPFVVSSDKIVGDPGSHAAMRADGLADLRLADSQGREVPYLLLDPPSRRVVWLSGTVTPILPTEKTSGFELDLGKVEMVDMLNIDGLPPPFMKRAVLEGSGDGTRWKLIGHVTLFNLPAERLRQTYVAFVPTQYRYLRLTWDDANSARLRIPPHAVAREALRRAPPPPERAAIEIVRRPSEPGRSRYALRLPAKGLPIVALTLDLGTVDVFRTATVTESRFNGERADPVELGREQLVRSTDDPSDGAPLRIPLQTPRSRELQLVIEDGNNAPLDISRASVEFATLPWIYFEAPDGPLVARYGDPAARAPQYDLEAKRSSIDLEAVAEAAWGEPRTTGTAAPAVPPPPIPDRGAHLDLTGFRYQRPLPDGTGTEAVAGPAGQALVALKLDAAALAHSRGPHGGFADVRIVDSGDNQIPYVRERRDEPLSMDLKLEPAKPRVAALTERAGNRSFYAVTLPYDSLPSPRLVLETPDRVFRRQVQIGVQRMPDRQRRDPWFDVLSSVPWQHADRETPAPPLEVAVERAAATEVLVVVEEGDNRPLTISAVRLLLPSWRVRFFRPSSPLRLVYGHSETGPPQYDLALLAPAVMGADATEIEAGAEAPVATATVTLLAPRTFWIGLTIAVLILLALIVRLIASGTAPPPSPPGP